jgi:hypothetical protein
MHDRVDLLGAQYPEHETLISDVSAHQRSPANCPFIPGAEVVYHDREVARAGERLTGMASDISGAAGN